MNNKLLQVVNLTTDFLSDGVFSPAVKGINFELNRGEILAIVGESGSGKSVTSLSAMGLIKKPGKVNPNSQVIFHQKDKEAIDFISLPDQEMRKFRGNRIAMIFQEPMTSLNPVFKCGDQVAEALILHMGMSKKEAKLRTIELFKEVLLPRPEAIYESYPHQISGGQKQRVMICLLYTSPSPRD